MPKKFLVIVVLFVVILGCLGKVSPHPLYYAFSASGAALEEAKIQAWAKLKYSITREEELQELLEAVVIFLVPAQDLTCRVENSEATRKVSMENANFYACLQSMNSTGETYLLMTWQAKDLSQDIDEKIFKIHKVFTALEAEPQIAVFLSGTIDEHLTQQQQEQIAQKMLNSVAASQIEGISVPELVSLTGYSPLIRDYLKVGRQKVNLNVATTFDEVRNKTVVHLGTPLLNGEY